ncbi:hypothetical protein C0J52_14718 [Blattella germanica]|nr:hypothetical protein C0J52_14718 [Blattella germanica]
MSRNTPLEEPKQNGAVIDKVEYLHFLYLKENNAATIHFELIEVYGNNAASYDTVVRWHRLFQCGQTSLNDKE